MQLSEVIEIVADAIVNKLGPTIIEKRAYLLGLSLKKRKSYRSHQLVINPINELIAEEIDKMSERGYLPEEINRDKLKTQIENSIKDLIVKMEDETVRDIITEFVDQKCQSKESSGAAKLLVQWRKTAKELLGNDERVCKSNKVWKDILDESQCKVRVLEYAPRFLQFFSCVVCVCLFLFHFLDFTAVSFVQYLGTICALFFFIFPAMPLLRIVKPLFEPAMAEENEKMRHAIKKVLKQYDQENKNTGTRLLQDDTKIVAAETNTATISADVISQPSIETVIVAQPTCLKKKKKNLPPKPVNDNEIKKSKQFNEVNLLKIKKTKNLYLFWSEKVVRRLLPSDQQYLLQKFSAAANNCRIVAKKGKKKSKGKTGLKPALFFRTVKTKSGNYEQGTHRLKINGSKARLWCVTRTDDERRVIVPVKFDPDHCLRR